MSQTQLNEYKDEESWPRPETTRESIKGDDIRYQIFYFRLITCYASIVLTATDAPYEIQEFRDNSGMYFEKFGHLHYARETWKLVIKLDHTTFTRRYEQITKYLHQIEVTCKTTQACTRIEAITEKEMKYLKNIMTQIQITD